MAALTVLSGPERRALLDQIMAHHPKLTLAKALIAFKEAGG
jgi:hypothetical protein